MSQKEDQLAELYAELAEAQKKLHTAEQRLELIENPPRGFGGSRGPKQGAVIGIKDDDEFWTIHQGYVMGSKRKRRMPYARTPGKAVVDGHSQFGLWSGYSGEDVFRRIPHQSSRSADKAEAKKGFVEWKDLTETEKKHVRNLRRALAERTHGQYLDDRDPS